VVYRTVLSTERRTVSL